MCMGRERILNEYCVVEKQVLNVGLKDFWFTKIFENLLQNYLLLFQESCFTAISRNALGTYYGINNRTKHIKTVYHYYKMCIIITGQLLLF